jgi:hypothetical protein
VRVKKTAKVTTLASVNPRFVRSALMGTGERVTSAGEGE